MRLHDLFKKTRTFTIANVIQSAFNDRFLVKQDENDVGKIGVGLYLFKDPPDFCGFQPIYIVDEHH